MMKCSNPYVHQSQALPCGQCLACRINKRRLWCHRIILESLQSTSNSFVTLTYSDENLPRTKNKSSWTLHPPHLRNWLKRLRFKTAPTKLRYFAVGEYGDQTERPHYHAALFGYSACLRGRSSYNRRRQDTCCVQCDLIRETWGHGNIFIGQLETQSAQYIAGYVVKKMTGKDDERLNGRYPEFSRMSLKPGIGAHLMADVASTLMEYDVIDVDVPGGLRHGSQIWPLGRYLRQQLRLQVGMEKETPQAAKNDQWEKMRPVREAAFNNSLSIKDVVTRLYEGETTRLTELERFNRRNKIL